MQYSRAIRHGSAELMKDININKILSCVGQAVPDGYCEVKVEIKFRPYEPPTTATGTIHLQQLNQRLMDAADKLAKEIEERIDI